MDYQVRVEQEIKVIDLAGELNSTTSSPIHKAISDELVAGESVILNMTHVSYMSSAGIRTLLLLYRSVMESGGQIVLVGLSEDLQDTLSLTGFLEFFNTQPTLDAGLQAMRT